MDGLEFEAPDAEPRFVSRDLVGQDAKLSFTIRKRPLRIDVGKRSFSLDATTTEALRQWMGESRPVLLRRSLERHWAGLVLAATGMVVVITWALFAWMVSHDGGARHTVLAAVRASYITLILLAGVASRRRPHPAFLWTTPALQIWIVLALPPSYSPWTLSDGLIIAIAIYAVVCGFIATRREVRFFAPEVLSSGP